MNASAAGDCPPASAMVAVSSPSRKPAGAEAAGGDDKGKMSHAAVVATAKGAATAKVERRGSTQPGRAVDLRARARGGGRGSGHGGAEERGEANDVGGDSRSWGHGSSAEPREPRARGRVGTGGRSHGGALRLGTAGVATAGCGTLARGAWCSTKARWRCVRRWHWGRSGGSGAGQWR
ncbi:uncharacterized protein [Miscanthus floridulus]|uniref:uncharacterized protein n=1 Tax=Miscanthus floridulus TaxID=154761 RepID=UPI0034586BE4